MGLARDEGMQLFLYSGSAFGEMWAACFRNDVLIGKKKKKKPFHHPHYKFMKLLLPNCVILIIADEIQSKAQYLRCSDLLEIQVWRQGNSLSG